MSLLFEPDSDRDVDLLSLGNPNIDLVFGVERVPLADQKCLGRHLGSFAGGTTANVACAAGRLGARTLAYGCIGDDANGHYLKSDFDRFAVSTEYLRVAPGLRSATAIILIDEQGEKALVYVPMQEDEASPVPPSDLLDRSRLVYSMPYDLESFQQVSRTARDRGASVVIDIEAAMARDTERLDALLKLSDVVFLSESSYRDILKVPPTAAGLQGLLAKGPRAVIVTLGAKGALAVTRDEVLHQVAFPATLVDTTGAGDCFIGSLLSAALAGQTLREALRFGCAAASLSLAGIGARTRLPRQDDIAAVLRAHPDL